MSWGVDGVSVRYGARPAVEHVSLDLPAGEVTAVVGGDGAGKTTLLRALVGVVAVAGGAVRRPGDHEIGYLASTSGTYPDLTVDENIAFVAEAYGVAPGEVRDRSRVYLERTGLDRFRDRLAGDLSGGMRQKLGVVRALIHRPPLLVLDEPTTGVDPVSRADLWWLIADAAAGGAAVVFTTTYLDEAERAGRLLVLADGRELATGTPAAIVASMPGTITAGARPPADAAAASRSWRRRAQWRQWHPDPDPDPDGDAAADAEVAAVADGGAEPDAEVAADCGAGTGGRSVVPDLHDAVTVFLLQRELASS